MTSFDIQKAVDSLPAEGGEVYIPAATYRLAKPIEIPANKSIKFVGQGAATVLLADYPSEPVVKIGGPGGGDRQFSKTISYLKLSRNPKHVQQDDVNAVGLLIDSVSYISIHDIHVTNQQCGIKITGDSANSRIHDCWFLLGIQEGIRIESGANYTVERCFMEPEWIGLYLDQCQAVWVQDCYILNGGGYDFGIVVRGGSNDFNITRCNLEGARKSSIYFENGINRSNIRGCWIGSSMKRPEGGGGNGIKLDPNCNRISISDNRIGDQHGAAIELDEIEGLTINNNLFDGIGIDGKTGVIYIEDSANIQICQNRFHGGNAPVGVETNNSTNVNLFDDNDFSQFVDENGHQKPKILEN